MQLQRWPGNVRQLKNVIEQTALFHAGQEVSRDILAQYIHNESESSLPATRQHSEQNEREKMLLKMVMALREETDMLKSRLDALEHRGDFRLVPENAYAGEPEKPMTTALTKYRDVNLLGLGDDPLADSERATIAAALASNDGNKKKTADDLNISLRTLYRKLHDLNIE
mgnify:FL=1